MVSTLTTRRPCFLVLCCLCCAVATLLFPHDVVAQAGGGGGYGGGGGGSGGGGSGGGSSEGLGILIYYLVMFTIEYPQFGIPIWIAIAVAYYFFHKTQREVRITRTIRRGRKVQEQMLRAGALDTIRSNDPGFDVGAFLARVHNAFVTTQHAWSEQELRSCRAFISDGVHERFQLYIAMQRAENIRNCMRDVQVREKEIIAVTSDTHFDTIHVRFVASAISYDEDLDTGKRVGGNSDRDPILFTEIWSFSRRPGVRTNPAASLLQGACPNCGGPVEIVDQAKCPQCESVVNSGQYDWVLAEITQDEEWVVPPARHLVSGWAPLAERDPSLNFQHVEDRASVVFWRCLMSIYFDDIGYATPVMTGERNAIPQLWQLLPGQFWMKPAVGVVEVERAIPAIAADPFDRIHVLVRWSGRRAEGARRRPRELDHQRIYSHVMVLKRRTGVTSRVEQAFASFSCQGCGAPIAVGKAAVCEFCHAPLNDGSTDWVLEDVTHFSAMSAYQREDQLEEIIDVGDHVERLETDRFLNEPELLAAVAKLMAVDGELHEKEKKHLYHLASRRGVSKQRLKQIFSTAIADEQPVQLPHDPSQAKSFMDHVIRAALIDGRITRQEQKMLAQVSQRFGWADVDLKMAIAQHRRELYQQAKEILHQRRKSRRSK